MHIWGLWGCIGEISMIRTSYDGYEEATAYLNIAKTGLRVPSFLQHLRECALPSLGLGRLSRQRDQVLLEWGFFLISSLTSTCKSPCTLLNLPYITLRITTA